MFPNWGGAIQIPQMGILTNGEFPWYRSFFYRCLGVGLFLSLGHDQDQYLFGDEALSLAGVAT